MPLTRNQLRTLRLASGLSTPVLCRQAKVRGLHQGRLCEFELNKGELNAAQLAAVSRIVLAAAKERFAILSAALSSIEDGHAVVPEIGTERGLIAGEIRT